jgi:hypothetical protein
LENPNTTVGKSKNNSTAYVQFTTSFQRARILM